MPYAEQNEVQIMDERNKNLKKQRNISYSWVESLLLLRC